MKIAIGSDHLGFPLKKEITDHLAQLNIEYVDLGVASQDEVVDYPDVAYRVTKSIKNRGCDRGILVCGTGIGMAIAANKIKGIYAAPCHDIYSAERSRKSNDTNVLTLGALVIGAGPAKMIVDAWLSSEFAGGGSAAKVRKIKQTEDETFRPENAQCSS